jgi:MFS family permease
MFLDMSRKQWMVLFAAWLGWGFDIFDGLLFNFVAPNCVPTLLGLPLGSDEARAATLYWTGVLSSVLLLGWAVGGVAFGWVADRLGRTRTLLLTMLLYSLGTALCAAAPNMGVLVACRVLASLGIGGEWAAGASLVAEVVPEHRRVEAGALLYTSAPLGLVLATEVTRFIQADLFAGSPETSWRWVFLCGLLPAVVALVVRTFVEEPERWKGVAATPPRMSELFLPAWRRRTLTGLLLALTALLMWWSVNAFLPVVARGLAGRHAVQGGLSPAQTAALSEAWVAHATHRFNLGGFLGTLAAVPIAKVLGRRAMFAIYFLAASAAIAATFGLDVADATRLELFFAVGLTTFGVFGSFTFYLPELYPTRLRATGAGFCYNAGRVVAAAGPFAVGAVAGAGSDALARALVALTWVAVIPLIGLLLVPFIPETRGVALAD